MQRERDELNKNGIFLDMSIEAVLKAHYAWSGPSQTRKGLYPILIVVLSIRKA